MIKNGICNYRGRPVQTVYLRKSKRKDDRVYLTLVEGYREGGKVKHKTVESLGCLDELEKELVDPIAHFKARCDEANAAARAGRQSVQIAIHPQQKIDKRRAARKNIGSAVLLVCLRRPRRRAGGPQPLQEEEVLLRRQRRHEAAGDRAHRRPRLQEERLGEQGALLLQERVRPRRHLPRARAARPGPRQGLLGRQPRDRQTSSGPIAAFEKERSLSRSQRATSRPGRSTSPGGTTSRRTSSPATWRCTS